MLRLVLQVAGLPFDVELTKYFRLYTSETAVGSRESARFTDQRRNLRRSTGEPSNPHFVVHREYPSVSRPRILIKGSGCYVATSL